MSSDDASRKHILRAMNNRSVSVSIGLDSEPDDENNTHLSNSGEMGV